MPEMFETEMGQESRTEHGTSLPLGCTCVPWPLLAAAQRGGAGSSAHGSVPHVSAECVAPDALRRVSKKCHRKGNCTVAADKATFGDPCLPGMKKQLRVSYTCGENSPRSQGHGGPCGASALPTPCQAGRAVGLPREAGAAGEEQGGDACCVLSFQCPSSCWRRWALTPRTPSCSRTTCTVTWGEEGYTTSSVAPCLCSGEPTVVCLHAWYQLQPSIPVPPWKPSLGQCPSRGDGGGICCEQGRGRHTGTSLWTAEHLCRKDGVWCGEGQAGAGSGTRGTESTSCLSLHPLVTAGGWYKGPRFSRLQEDRMIFTSSLAAFAHLWGMCPPWVSRSTWGNRTGWGVADIPDGPSSTQGSSQSSQTPNLSSRANRHMKEQGTKPPCWVWGGQVGWELRGAASLKVSQHQESRCGCSPACGHSFSNRPDYPLSLFLPALPAGTDGDHLSAGKNFPCQRKLLI